MNRQNNFIIFLLFVFLVIALILFWHAPLKVDEQDHYPQTVSYVNGDYAKPYLISTLTTYHAVLAVISKVAGGITSIKFFRAINLLFALIAIFIFGKICVNLKKEMTEVSMMQFAFFPIIFPYFFLVYTDILSLLMVLAAIYFLVRKKYQWSGLFSIFACAVRQDNIIWLGFFFILTYADEYGFKFRIKDLFQHLLKLWTFLAGLILFIIFVIINKGIAVGDKSMHPAFSFHLGNIYFFLFLFFFLFAALNISNFNKIVLLIKKRKLIIAGIVIFYLLFIFTFSNDHPFNYQWGDYYLRNAVLIFFTSSWIHKTVFFICAAYAILSLCVTEFRNKNFYLLYPFTFLFLIPSWLIEQRYYFIPFTLFLLFKKEDKKWVEWSTLALFVFASGLFYFVIRGNRYFL